MASNHPEKQKLYNAKHYANPLNLARLKASNDRRQKVYKYLLKRQKRKSCFDCGIRYKSYIMDFDHRDPAEKFRTISRMIANRAPWGTILAEIAKCDLVCANCHRERTHNLFNSERSGGVR